MDEPISHVESPKLTIFVNEALPIQHSFAVPETAPKPIAI